MKELDTKIHHYIIARLGGEVYYDIRRDSAIYKSRHGGTNQIRVYCEKASRTAQYFDSK